MSCLWYVLGRYSYPTRQVALRKPLTYLPHHWTGHLAERLTLTPDLRSIIHHLPCSRHCAHFQATIRFRRADSHGPLQHLHHYFIVSTYLRAWRRQLTPQPVHA